MLQKIDPEAWSVILITVAIGVIGAIVVCTLI
jgi:hypothetical protein